MQKDDVISILDSLANAIDPALGGMSPLPARNPHDVVRALSTASTWLREDDARRTSSRARNAEQRFAAGSPWSDEEDERLGREFDAGMTAAEIGIAHGRSTSAIMLRLVKLGRVDPSTVRARQRGVRAAS